MAYERKSPTERRNILCCQRHVQYRSLKNAFLPRSFVVILGLMEIPKRAESAQGDNQSAEKWWECCPLCGSKMFNQKCRYLCSNEQCHFFMSCSEYDRKLRP